MTELSGPNQDSQLGKSAGYEINKWDFYIALIGAPLLIAVLFFWVILIPVAAVWIGGIPWLVFGGPALWFTLRYRGPGPMLIVSAFLANALCTSLLMVFLTWASARPGQFSNDLEQAVFVPLFGCIFSLIWAGAFWLIFNRLTKRRMAQNAKPAPNSNQATAEQ